MLVVKVGKSCKEGYKNVNNIRLAETKELEEIY